MFYDLLKICVSICFNILNTLLGGKLPPFGCAAVIVEEEGRYLVVELPRKRLVFPGGFMTWREHPAQSAAREGKEETGFTLQIDDLISFYPGISANWLQMSSISFVYCAHIVGGTLRNNIEGKPLWLYEEDLRKRMSKQALTLLDDYLQYRESHSVQVQ